MLPWEVVGGTEQTTHSIFNFNSQRKKAAPNRLKTCTGTRCAPNNRHNDSAGTTLPHMHADLDALGQISPHVGDAA